MQIGFMPEKIILDAVFILRRLQEEYHAKVKNVYMCFEDPEKAFVKIPRTLLECEIRKIGIPEVLVRSVMILYERVKTRVQIDSGLSEEFEEVKVGMHQGSVLSPFLFALVLDVVTEFARGCALSELLYADDFVLMSYTIYGLVNKLIKWKVAWEN